MLYFQELQGLVPSLLAHASICHLPVRMIPLTATAPWAMLKNQLFHQTFYDSIDQPSKKSISPCATAYSSPHLTTPRVWVSRVGMKKISDTTDRYRDDRDFQPYSIRINTQWNMVAEDDEREREFFANMDYFVQTNASCTDDVAEAIQR